MLVWRLANQVAEDTGWTVVDDVAWGKDALLWIHDDFWLSAENKV